MVRVQVGIDAPLKPIADVLAGDNLIALIRTAVGQHLSKLQTVGESHEAQVRQRFRSPASVTAF